jgi:hypothetical protein
MLLQQCLPVHAGGRHSQFCEGYISGVLHMAEHSKEVCQVSDKHEIEKIIEAVRNALELNYEYRSSPAEGWVLNTVKNHFCN